MININLDAKLDIILPNTNRALAEVLKDASPKVLEAITQGKDLKSIMNSILKESSQNSSSDKVLLELVKSNPTLKELGSVNENIKNLLTTLKSDKTLEPILIQIQKLLPDVKELKNINIKSTIENSGVFLESKLKNIQNPQIKLASILNDLSAVLQKSKLPISIVVNSHVKELLASPLLKEASNEVSTQHIKESPKALQDLAKGVESILNRLNSELKSANPITTKDFEVKLAKLENLIEPKNLEKENFKLLPLQVAIKELTKTLDSSFTKESKGIVDALNKIFKAIKSIEQNQSMPDKVLPQKVMPEKIAAQIRVPDKTIPNTIADGRVVSDKTVPQNILHVKTMAPEKTLPQAVPQTIATDKTVVDKTILQTIVPNKTISDISILEKIIDKKIPLEIKMTVEDIKTAIKESDQLFSKPSKVILNELLQFKSSLKLSPEQNIKDILSNDLKAVLHKVSDEISKVTIPAQSDLLKQIDKLSLQIDYYQLISHLSNATSLYVPFSWEEMQEGNITIKKAQKDKFYCDINLKLKEYGELKLRLTLYEKNQLNIHINSDNEEFKAIMREYIPELRKALIDMQITPREIRFFNKSKNSEAAYDTNSEHLNMRFEIKA